GAARRPRSAAERSRPARRRRKQSRRAGGRARGGARAAGESRRAVGGGGDRSARGCGSRTPRPQQLLLEEPKGHRSCPRPASGHRCFPGAARGLASVKCHDV
ncbi:hypothetical protein MC885_003001, partial [Smutsia gigantea]